MRGMRTRKTELTPLARELRRNSTDAERKLWSLLHNRSLFGCKFRRQFPVGPFIADFACTERRLIVELDGSQHTSNIEVDEQRTTYLKSHGYAVLRFWDNDVLARTESVAEAIRMALDESARPSP